MKETYVENSKTGNSISILEITINFYIKLWIFIFFAQQDSKPVDLTRISLAHRASINTRLFAFDTTATTWPDPKRAFLTHFPIALASGQSATTFLFSIKKQQEKSPAFGDDTLKAGLFRQYVLFFQTHVGILFIIRINRHLWKIRGVGEY